MPVSEGDLLWEADAARKNASNVCHFMRWLERERGVKVRDYGELHRWSVAEIEEFWRSVWIYFEVVADGSPEPILAGTQMPGMRWFGDSRLNFAEHVLRHEAARPDETVFHHLSELRPLGRMTWRELGIRVRRLAAGLKALGVGPGDRVVSYMPNIPETMVAMLATTAIGAVWSSAAPEFGVEIVRDRFSQIAPKVMFAADGYRFGGKDFVRAEQIGRIAGALPSLETIVWLDYLGGVSPPAVAAARILPYEQLVAGDGGDFSFARVPPDHPLWILFSSGTTGLPKAIVHNHHGIVAEFYKFAAFHLDLRPSSCMFFYSTTGWMMWNALVWAPMMGGAAVLYDGHPSHPTPDLLWDLAARTGTTSFGTSPTFVDTMRRFSIVPSERHDLSAVDNVFLAGSPAMPESFAWLYENVKADMWVTSQSGGTEFCSGLVGASPLLPVRAAEIQCACLACEVRILDDAGNGLVEEAGELVVGKPMPSMPIFLWGDEDFRRYREAYFDVYEGLWRHGDFIRVSRHGGYRIHGRSDSTLNRFGVRMGSAEIYMTLDAMEEIADSLVVCIELPDGGYYMPLFVVLKPGRMLTDAIAGDIRDRLRRERSPRHVPDEIIAVPAIPYTLTGKRMEVPVRKLLMGWPERKAFSRDTMRDPKAMDWFVEFATTRKSSAKC
ncbi:MAG: acetoacetyl-CoA synthetase [Alphaproteobacteria bacterium]|nr:MAG: acetoacetyl-CoA synthetase [Alphaproteobacteria bacterium]